MSGGSNDNNNGQSAGSPQERGEEMLLHCKSASLSDEDLLKIIERCEWTPDTTQIIRCLLEYFPDASTVDARRRTPLHYACDNKNATLGIIQLLIDAAPDYVRSMTNYGNMPLHILCLSSKVDETAAIEILKLLIEKCPEAVRHADKYGVLPIHIAAEKKSPGFCRALIEAYPGSEHIADKDGVLPLHFACGTNSVDTVEYLYGKYPAAIDHATTEGFYPIHHAISTKFRDKPAAAVEIVRFLLGRDPNVKFQQYHGQSLLRYAYGRQYNDSSIDAGIQIITIILNSHPDSIRSQDNNGWMPIHHLCNSISVGEMDEAAAVQILKLLIEQYPEAVRHADKYGDLPIHYAAVRKSPEFCRALIEAYSGSEHIANNNGALPLHLACGKNTVDTVEYLYQTYPAAIDHATTEGFYPIHHAISTKFRDKPEAAVEIVRYLLDRDPNVKLQQFHGQSLLRYYACNCGRECNDSSIDVSIQIIKIIFDAHPVSIRSEDNNGWMPLHHFCSSISSVGEMDEAAAIKILKLLIEKYPEAVRHAANDGWLPIHYAATRKSPEFCRVLIEAYPGSEHIADNDGVLPLHLACGTNTVDTVEYLHQQYPAAINHAVTVGFYPIHHAISTKFRDGTRENPAAAVEIVQFLLNCPDQKLIRFHGRTLLHYACERQYNSDSHIDAGIQIIKMIFDAHPEAIEDNTFSADIQSFHRHVQAFINGELVYARQAKNRLLMTTPDDNGQLPLHRALQNNVGLGSIKLLVKGNPAAVVYPNNSGTMPLHIACEHHGSIEVIEYLVGLDPSSLDAVAGDGNTALHYACSGAKHHTIALLVKKYDAVSVSKRNADGKLPIDLLWESNEVSDRESVKYMGSVFQLVRAYPEMNYMF